MPPMAVAIGSKVVEGGRTAGVAELGRAFGKKTSCYWIVSRRSSTVGRIFLVNGHIIID
jgi:hypothetical protein